MSPAGWGALVLANDHPSGLVVNKGTTAHGVRHSYLLADRSVTLTGGRWTVATSRRPPSCRSPSQGLAADGTDVPDDRRNVTGRRGEGAVTERRRSGLGRWDYDPLPSSRQPGTPAMRLRRPPFVDHLQHDLGVSVAKTVDCPLEPPSPAGRRSARGTARPPWRTTLQPRRVSAPPSCRSGRLTLGGYMGLTRTRQSKNPTLWAGLSACFSGRPCGIRTCDQRIKSPLLYQLS
jgi:hypothetical protein